MNISLSVIIPVYNGSKYLEKAVNSVTGCTDKDFEIILIDDGSTDDTPALCDKLQNSDSRIHTYHIENYGVSNARNFGIEKAKGEFLTFLDADDEFFQGAFEKAKADLVNQENDFIIYPYSITDENGYEKNTIELFSTENPTKKEILMHFINSSKMNFCWGKIYRTQFIKNNSVKFNLDLAVGEDVDFQISLFKHEPSIRYCFLKLIKYRQNSSGVMHRYDFTRFDNLKECYIMRKELSSQIDFTKEDEEGMYCDLGRRLLSYVKNVSKLKPKKEVVSKLEEYLEIPEIKTILKNIPLHRMGAARKIIGKLLQKGHYGLAVRILSFI